jgi:hypothetical protein
MRVFFNKYCFFSKRFTLGTADAEYVGNHGASRPGQERRWLAQTPGTRTPENALSNRSPKEEGS